MSDDEAAPPVGSPNPADGSKFARIRAAYAAELEPERFYLAFMPRDIGGEKFEPVGEYRVLTQEEIDELNQAAGDKSVDNAIAMLSQALTGVFVHDPGHDDANASGCVEMQAWFGEDALAPLGMDRRLRDLIGLKLPGDSYGVQEIMLAMFGGKEPYVVAKARQLDVCITTAEGALVADFAPGS